MVGISVGPFKDLLIPALVFKKVEKIERVILREQIPQNWMLLKTASSYGVRMSPELHISRLHGIQKVKYKDFSLPNFLCLIVFSSRLGRWQDTRIEPNCSVSFSQVDLSMTSSMAFQLMSFVVSFHWNLFLCLILRAHSISIYHNSRELSLNPEARLFSFSEVFKILIKFCLAVNQSVVWKRGCLR